MESQQESYEDAELMACVRGEDFSFEGKQYIAKVVDLYDGDTVRVKFRFNGEIVQYVARMNGYDSPEMHPLKSNENREDEMTAAKYSKQSLIDKIGGNLVNIKCGKFDKYGRLLVTMFTAEGEDINQWMIDNSFGVPYSGGKKGGFKK